MNQGTQADDGQQEHPRYGVCPNMECLECGTRDCPSEEPLHYHHDGCPICHRPDDAPEERFGEER